jgi:hypothetical protein
MDLIFRSQAAHAVGQFLLTRSIPAGINELAQGGGRATPLYLNLTDGGRPACLAGRPSYGRLWCQSAGGCSVMAMVPVKISSLTMKAIAVT